MGNINQFTRHKRVAFILTLAGFILCTQLLYAHFIMEGSSVNALNDPRNYFPMESLHPSDYSRLMNVTDFSFKLLANPCKDNSPTLLVMVYSAPDNIPHRQQIRRTWGRKMQDVHVLFLLGDSKTPRVQIELAEEQDIYHDLVQGSFMDTYINLTYKHAALFKYSVYHCPSAKYVLKADDDVFVNLMTLMDYLSEELPLEGAKDFIFCRVRPKPPVFRNVQSKWYLSHDEYPNDNFPDMCPGWTLLYSNDVLFKLYRELQNSSYFWIEDVLVTGILREKLELSLVSSLEWIISDTNMKKIANKETIEIPPYIYGPADGNLTANLLLWTYTMTHVKPKKYRYLS